MILNTVLTSLNEIAPLANAEMWDNVGLLVGDPKQSISQIMLTIDYTAEVAHEAEKLKCDLVIAYHPPIFSAIKRITDDGPSGLLHRAIRRGIAIYSPHTAWDAANGGANDVLAQYLGLKDVTPLRAIQPAGQYLKLVTFVPESHVDAVSYALFAVGAGHIGNYHSCSFRAPGLGTFFGQPGANPAVGKVGILEKQPEIRLETIVPIAKTRDAVQALIRSHPYEEPAYDLTPLAALPSTTGHGRIGNLPETMQIEAVIDRLKKTLDLDRLLVGESKQICQRIAICAGSGGELLDDAIRANADVFLTGELRHHDVLKALNNGISTICTLHSNSERPSLTRLMARLQQSLGPQAPPMVLSQADRDPLSIR
jgi:dinuclear metal center YbgI/SA1388 family protein